MTQKRTYYEDIKNSEVSSSSTSSTTVLCPEDEEMLQNYYEYNFGTRMPYPIAGLIKNACRLGMQPETVCMAIDETMFAPRPTPHYLRAILLRWMQNGIFDTLQVLQDKEMHEARKDRDRRARWDREYGELP